MSYMQECIDLVMLVDKNPETNYINRKLIEITKFARTVVTKTSEDKAIEYLQTNKRHIALLPDIILLDVSGSAATTFEFLDRLEELADYLNGKCKTVILSNSLKTGEIDVILKKRIVAGSITKPLLVEKLNLLKSSYFKAPNSTQRIN